MQKTLDKGRKHVLDYMTLILYLVHFLEVIHNIWMSAVVIFYFQGDLIGIVVRTDKSKQRAPNLNGQGDRKW
jgi:hypothetical protein